MAITLEQTNKAMMGLVQSGIPNVKLAFWSSALSKRNSLAKNCIQSTYMRQYAYKPLPTDRNELRSALGNPMWSTVNTLYAIEQLDNDGLLNFDCGDTYESQALWREKMVQLIPGMGYKTVSFALHIYNPFGCKLLTIDCWHVRRMHECFGPISNSNYLQYESKLQSDIDELAKEQPGYSPIVYAAYLWENTRKPNATEYQSHNGLSCYVNTAA